MIKLLQLANKNYPLPFGNSRNARSMVLLDNPVALNVLSNQGPGNIWQGHATTPYCAHCGCCQRATGNFFIGQLQQLYHITLHSGPYTRGGRTTATVKWSFAIDNTYCSAFSLLAHRRRLGAR